MLNQHFALAAIISLLFSGNGASGCRPKRPINSQANNSRRSAPQKPDANTGELKVLTEGFHSSINEPFVAVIHDADTYASLMKEERNLPQLGDDFFNSNIVIAAFLGQRNTGGYSVEIRREQNGQIRVSEKAPAKGTMVPQMITAPFGVVSFETSGTAAVLLAIDQAFQRKTQPYRVTSGTFTVSGGFTGRSESFALAGKLQVMRLGDLMTIGFTLVGNGTSRERSLRDSATTVIKDHSFTIRRMSRGSLLDPPSGDLHISGTFVDNNRLSLEIGSAPINVPENYSGKGTVEAELVKPSSE
jgi:hypothetical protein